MKYYKKAIVFFCTIVVIYVFSMGVVVTRNFYMMDLEGLCTRELKTQNNFSKGDCKFSLEERVKLAFVSISVPSLITSPVIKKI